MKTYFNTTNEKGKDLASNKRKARNQQGLVLKHFEERPGQAFTPFMVQGACLPRAPITSVRRAMTNLTEAGELVKTKSMFPGRLGRQNYLWMLARYEEQLSLF